MLQFLFFHFQLKIDVTQKDTEALGRQVFETTNSDFKHKLESKHHVVSEKRQKTPDNPYKNKTMTNFDHLVTSQEEKQSACQDKQSFTRFDIKVTSQEKSINDLDQRVTNPEKNLKVTRLTLDKTEEKYQYLKTGNSIFVVRTSALNEQYKLAPFLCKADPLTFKKYPIQYEKQQTK